MHVRTGLVAHLRDCLFATPEDIGEPSKESKEQMEERHHRVCTQVILALSGIAKLFPSPQPDHAAHAASSIPKTDIPGEVTPVSQQEHANILQALALLWEDKAFWECLLQNPQPAVFNAGCHLVSQLIQLQNDMVQRIESTLAPLVFASLQSATEPCNAAAWNMVLRFTAAFPEALSIPSVSNSLPRHVCAIVKTGPMTRESVTGLVPLSVQMLRHGPSGWKDGSLGKLWLPTALKRYHTAPAAALSAAAETVVGLLLVMVSKGTESASAAQELAMEVVAEASASSKALAWVQALWKGVKLIAFLCLDIFVSKLPAANRICQVQCFCSGKPALPKPQHTWMRMVLCSVQ